MQVEKNHLAFQKYEHITKQIPFIYSTKIHCQKVTFKILHFLRFIFLYSGYGEGEFYPQAQPKTKLAAKTNRFKRNQNARKRKCDGEPLTMTLKWCI